MVDALLADVFDATSARPQGHTSNPPNAAEFLSRLQRQIEELFEHIVAPADGRLERFDDSNCWQRFANSGGDSQRALRIRQLLLTLELHCKLEEQLLTPNMQDGGHLQPAVLDVQRSKLRTLRDLIGKVRGTEQTPGIQLQWLLTLQGVAMLHFDNVQRHLRRNVAPMRRRQLGTNIQAMLQRWKRELRPNSAIQDEEANPVGLPPG